ncbi:MAG: Ca2+-binding EF-hand superfamily protein [Verrucomicrobiales bacterium]|jgi:Ca2+-binding EF-hand superfamily protein
MKNHTLLIGTVLGVALALPACNKKDLITKLDTNDDNRVSEAEFRAGVQQEAFEAIDADTDGVVTVEEWTAHEDVREPMQRFNNLDDDDSRSLSFDEFASKPRKGATLGRIFSTLDTNGDGFITDNDVTN